MVLKALEIQGFKSFPDKTRITFDKGITAVVGPNGSGKSNISDAMRWVLGENSAKQLRSSGKMEEVIFGGAKGRGPMGYAAVTVYIDNTDRRLAAEADEVAITRRYYRSGASEYTINGQNVRQKDVYELLLDTGIGRDGYSTIEQGKIAEIVGARSDQRREIFEEASGIAKYRYRKNEAEDKLRGAEDNLVRLRDILSELSDRVGPLEKESAKAKEFLALSARRKELEVTLWDDSLRRSRDTLREQQRKIEVARSDYDAVERAINEAEAAQEASFQQARELEKEIEARGEDARRAGEERARAEAEIAARQGDIARAQADEAAARNELSGAGEGSAAIVREREEQQALVARAQTRLADIEEELAGLSGELADLSRRAGDFDGRQREMEERLDALLSAATELRVEQAGLQTGLEAARSRMDIAGADREAGEKELAGLTQEAEKAAAGLEKARRDLSSVENAREGITMKLESRRKKAEEADAAFERISREQEAAAQRMGILQDLERSMDGLPASVKAVMTAGQSGKLGGLIGPVAGILTVAKGYETAIETALGYALQNIVVEREINAKDAIAYLKRTGAGRATFLPLDTVQHRMLDAGARLEGAMPAADAVKYDPRYERVVSNLLGRILVVDDIHDAGRVARANGYRYRVVTKDGQLVGTGGSFTGGSAARSGGVFTRRQELDELRERAPVLAKRLEDAREARRLARLEADSLTAQLTAAEGEIAACREEVIRTQGEDRRLAQLLERGQADLALLSDECAALTATIEENTRRGAQVESLLAENVARTGTLQSEFTAAGKQGEEYAQRRAALSDRQQALRMEELTVQKDTERYNEAIAALDARQAGAARLAQEADAAIQAAVAAAQGAQEEIERQSARLVQLGKELDQAQEAALQARSRKQALEQTDSELRAANRANTDERERVSRELARLEERRVSMETEYDNTTARLWDEYELTPADAAAMAVPFTGITELRRQVNETRGAIRALGNVNVAAIEEYTEVSARYEFLKTQVADVEGSKAQLQKLIAGLQREMEDIFTQKFAQINENFGRIFTELFEGGSARLYLTDGEDVLGSGIEIEVSPPGKVIKSLTALSGGERSLLAIAIYFAILAVNPSPFCILDEIEAALDDVNVNRFAAYLRRICAQTQFVAITHRRGTMEEADVLYGVTMQEDGISKILRLDMAESAVKLIS